MPILRLSWLNSERSQFTLGCLRQRPEKADGNSIALSVSLIKRAEKSSRRLMEEREWYDSGQTGQSSTFFPEARMMGDPTTASDPAGPPLPNPSTSAGGKEPSRNDTTDKFMGVTLKGWAISAISAIAVLTATGTGLVTVYSNVQSLKAEAAQKSGENEALVSKNADLTNTVKLVSDDTQSKLTEAEKHAKLKDRFESIPIENKSEIVNADYYPSDGCVHISRKQTTQQRSGGAQSPDVYYGNDQDVWIVDPLKNAGTQNAALSNPIEAAVRASLLSISQKTSQTETNQKAVKAYTTATRSASSKPRLVRVGMFQTNCINPHPGTFTLRNEQVDACNAKVWRTFADGCVHYQMYNACSGKWDPKINWTACVAQHHP